VPAENLLVVDDDQAFLDLMAHHLRRKGHNVECTLDGKEALHALQSKGPFTILITDLMMPGMSGLELLRHARKLDPTIEVIVITAAPSLEMAISAMREDGAFDYLTKPLDMMGELSLVIERAADHRRMKIEREDLRERLIHGADRLWLVLANTSASILAVDENDKVIVASTDITGHLDHDDQEDELDVSQMPGPLLDLVSQWQDLGCPKSANVEVYWPEDEIRLMNIAPISSGEGITDGWVMMLHRASSQKRIESFVLEKIICLGQRIRSPMAAATSMLKDIESQFSINETQVSDKVAAIKECIDRVIADSSDLSVFDNNVQVENKTLIPLPDFISREEERLINEFGIVNQFNIKWDLKSDLPQVKVDLQLMYQILQHLSHWASNPAGRSTSVIVTCWNQSNRIWFRIYGAESVPSQAEDISTGNNPLELVGRMEQSEIHLAFAKSFVQELNGRLWTWNDENEGANAAFFVPIV
jgi:CheY-like chemotaxis protein